MTDAQKDGASYRISVVIPAYNVEAYAGRAIETVLAQSHPADEIIIIDDGSTDGTAEIVKRFCPQAQYHYQENAGLSAARNAGIRASTMPWLAFLDSDDEWLPDYLESQLELLRDNPQLKWVGANFYRHRYADDYRRANMDPETGKRLLNGKQYFDSYFSAFLQRALGNSDTMIIHRSVFDEVGMFREGMRRIEDEDMWFRIAYRWPQYGYNPQPLAVYYQGVPGSITQIQTDHLHICDLVARHLQLAEQAGRLDDFQPCAAFMLQWWMRRMLFDRRIVHIKEMTTQFQNVLPDHFQRVMRLLSIAPIASMHTCRLLSRINRVLCIRK